jgi:WD40 repeat protein
VRIWDATTAAVIAVLHGHQKSVQTGEFDRDGRIVTASWDYTARIWGAHLQPMSAKDFLAEACVRLGVCRN